MDDPPASPTDAGDYRLITYAILLSHGPSRFAPGHSRGMQACRGNPPWLPQRTGSSSRFFIHHSYFIPRKQELWRL